MKIFSNMQVLGKALMLPLAVLPVAALMLRLGQGDLLDAPWLAAAGNAIFENLALLFGIGVAIGLSRDGNGAAALAGAVGHLTIVAVATAIDKEINFGVFSGIIGGLIGGWSYNRFHMVQLPDFLGFFGGRRLVPIVTGLIAVAIAYPLAWIWPVFQHGLNTASEWIAVSGSIGLFTYGFLNRILIPTGLHHILNSFVWFAEGDFVVSASKVVHGDLNRFFAGDSSAGLFMTGFFPIMMFGLPAAALAMFVAAKPERRAEVSGALFSVAFTSFLTGITEPIEFMFMFIAPGLYFLHAVLTGVSMAWSIALGVKHGFGFSAGAIDYVLNWNLATHPVLILFPLGVVFFIVYFVVFYGVIRFGKLPTLGNEGEQAHPGAQKELVTSDLATGIVTALGGYANIQHLDACVTRLRVKVHDIQQMSQSQLETLGLKGILVSGQAVQLVVGTQADLLSQQIHAADPNSVKAQ